MTSRIAGFLPSGYRLRAAPPQIRAVRDRVSPTTTACGIHTEALNLLHRKAITAGWGRAARNKVKVVYGKRDRHHWR